MKKEVKRITETTMAVAKAARACFEFQAMAGMAAPVRRNQRATTSPAKAIAATGMTKVSLVACIKPRLAPASRAQPMCRVRVYRQPAASKTIVKQTSSIS